MSGGTWASVAIVSVLVKDGHYELEDEVVAKLRESLHLWASRAAADLGYTEDQVGEVLVA